MEERDSRPRNRNLLWVLVLVAVVFLWWYFRPGSTGDVPFDDHRTNAAMTLGADPDDILVDFEDDVSTSTVEAVERELGIDLVLVSKQSEDERFYRAHVDPYRQASILAALSKRGDVEVAEPDSVATLSPTAAVLAPLADGQWADYPNDPQYKYQWHMRQVHMPEAWKIADGDGVIVAVLDTGVAYEDHTRFHLVQDLEGVEFVKPFDFVSNDEHANDDHGHGTHVAGTIAQTTHNGKGVTGIARNVKIMPLKVLSGSGSGSVAGIADAIRYAADEGAQVINMSLGGPFPSRALKNAVKYAYDKGVVVVCAAGNDGRNKVGYPAAYPGAFAVSATQYDESITFYSNYGKHIDIAAPGGNTRVDQNNDGMPDGVLQNTIAIGDPTQSDYFGYMGTSMASPHVAGVAALVVGEGVTDPGAVENILEQSARGPSKGDLDKNKYGAGIVDAHAAVLKARSETGGWQFGLGLLMAVAVASSLRRRGLLGVRMGPSYLAGVAVGASGLFFLPYLAPSLASLPVLDTLTRGLPSWDLSLLGAAGHGNALFFSALVPLGLTALLFGVNRLRPLLAGLAVGVAAHLVFHAATGIADVRWIPNALALDELWLLGNAGLCLLTAHLALRR
jgi:serine protease